MAVRFLVEGPVIFLPEFHFFHDRFPEFFLGGLVPAIGQVRQFEIFQDSGREDGPVIRMIANGGQAVSLGILLDRTALAQPEAGYFHGIEILSEFQVFQGLGHVPVVALPGN